MKDIAAALRGSIQYLRGRKGPDNDPFLFVRVVTSMDVAANEIERLRLENAKLRQVAEQVVKWPRAPIPFAYVQLAREVL